MTAKAKTASPGKVAVAAFPPSIQSRAIELAAMARRRVDKHLVIENDAQAELASEFRSSMLKPAIDEIEGDTKPLISTAHQLHKGLTALRAKWLEPLQDLDRQVKAALDKYATRRYLEQQAERRRLEAAMTAEAKTQAIIEAQALLEDGDEDAAQEILDRVENGQVAAAAPLPASVHRGPALSNSSTRIIRKFRITDVGKMKREYMTPNVDLIQSIVDRLGEGAIELVGTGAIEVYEEASTATRRS